MTSSAPPAGSDGPADARARLAGAAALLERLFHDLKQPLNVVRIVAQDVRLDARKGRLDAAALPTRMLEIEQAVDEVCERIDQLRTFARPTRPRAAAGAADVAEAVGAAVARIRGAHPRLKLDEHIPPGLPAVALDAFDLEQALWEILDNGTRAADPDSEARVAIAASLTSDRAVVVTVRDFGSGVPEEARQRIFEPFFTLRPGAAGLGLAAALALVTQAGGTIRCQESSAAGTVFEIRLPAHP